MAAAAILKIWKIATSRPRFQRFRLHLAWWCSSTFLNRSDCYKFKIYKSKMAEATILKNPKIAISRQRFDRSTQNLARLRILALRTEPAVEILKFKKIQDGVRPLSWKMISFSLFTTNGSKILSIQIHNWKYLTKKQKKEKKKKHTHNKTNGIK